MDTYAVDGLLGGSMLEHNLELGEISSEFS
jgi:hypothetical protein